MLLLGGHQQSQDPLPAPARITELIHPHQPLPAGDMSNIPKIQLINSEGWAPPERLGCGIPKEKAPSPKPWKVGSPRAGQGLDHGAGILSTISIGN